MKNFINLLNLYKLKLRFNSNISSNEQILVFNTYKNYLKVNQIHNYSIMHVFQYSKHFQIFSNNINKNINTYYYKYFLEKFINNVIQHKKIHLIIKNYNTLIYESSFYKNLYIKLRRSLSINDLKFSGKYLLNLIITILLSKDIILLKNFIINCLEKLYYKRHRRFLANLKSILLFLYNTFKNQFNISGIFLRVSGKIGVGGSLKKRKFIFKIGNFSLTQKNQKLNYTKDVARTISGVLGIKILISYK